MQSVRQPFLLLIDVKNKSTLSKYSGNVSVLSVFPENKLKYIGEHESCKFWLLIRTWLAYYSIEYNSLRIVKLNIWLCQNGIEE